MELKVSLDNTIMTRRVVSWIILNFFDSGSLSGEGLWAWKNFSMDHKRCRENLNLKSAILSGITGFIRGHRLRFQMHITAHRTKAKNPGGMGAQARKVWQADTGDKAKVKYSTSSKHFWKHRELCASVTGVDVVHRYFIGIDQRRRHSGSSRVIHGSTKYFLRTTRWNGSCVWSRSSRPERFSHQPTTNTYDSSEVHDIFIK